MASGVPRFLRPRGSQSLGPLGEYWRPGPQLVCLAGAPATDWCEVSENQRTHHLQTRSVSSEMLLWKRYAQRFAEKTFVNSFKKIINLVGGANTLKIRVDLRNLNTNGTETV